MRRLALLAVCVALAADGVQAQSVSAGALLQSYRFTTSSDLRLHSIHLATFPFSAGASWRSSLEMGVLGAYAKALTTLSNGDEGSLDGLVDTRVFVGARLGGAFVQASALLPTGDVVSTADAATVVGLLSTDLLPFAVSQWGTGGGFAGDLGYGGRVGESMIQVSVGASMLRESKPLTSEIAYLPGTELRSRIVVESALGPAGRLSVLIGYQHYLADAYDGRNIFEPGGRIEGAVSYGFPLGPRRSVLAYANVRRLQGGVSQTTEPDILRLISGFPGVLNQPTRTLFAAGSEMRMDRGSYSLAPRAEVRLLRREDGAGQGWLVSLGGGAEIRLGMGPFDRPWVLQPTLAARAGRLVAAGGIDSTIVGGELGFSLGWGTR